MAKQRFPDQLVICKLLDTGKLLIFNLLNLFIAIHFDSTDLKTKKSQGVSLALLNLVSG